jgi:predicted glycogen debranching enzyme
MDTIIRRIDLSKAKGDEARRLLARQWLATNGLGGYASGTISGNVTWRYHGLLIAALPAPFGRMVMLNHVAETIIFKDGRAIEFAGHEEPRQASNQPLYLKEFRLENHLPVWCYEVEGVTIEKHVLFLHGQNTVHIKYRVLSEHEQFQLQLRPSVHFRGHEMAVDEGSLENYELSVKGNRYAISAGENLPCLRLVLKGEKTQLVYDGGSRREIFYQQEADRGYQSRGVLWTPGFFRTAFDHQCDATLIASTEAWNTMLALSPAEALEFYNNRHKRLVSTSNPALHGEPASELVLAADQFIINPAGRIQDTARAHAAGDEIRTIIAGYHWFTDWGRDTMISLEGLTLSTRRFTEAAWILRTFAHYIHDGLIPNMFPEGENKGLYHTADATLWFFHALARYVEITGDRATLRHILPKLIDIVEHHLKGTKFGIGVDPADGLLRQGAEGYQLTWMDAKVDGWVVTPRRGKAVEINGLWYNALRLVEEWVRQERGEEEAHPYKEHADKAQDSFNKKFWFAPGNYLYDIVEGEKGNESACRPNQLFAFSLEHPILKPDKWEPVLNVVKDRLLTPVGLRSLSQDHPDYKPIYFGDLRARDAAYHQGTVWGWLIGPFIDCWLKVHPGNFEEARSFLRGFGPHIDEACIGSISEIFDAEPPFTPRGCIAQAWSVAEVLRCWVKTTGAIGPAKKLPHKAKAPVGMSKQPQKI